MGSGGLEIKGPGGGGYWWWVPGGGQSLGWSGPDVQIPPIARNGMDMGANVGVGGVRTWEEASMWEG